jgi:hypothetical protein
MVAAALLASASASCAAIGGLGDFTEVDCVGTSCDGGAVDGSGNDGAAPLDFATIGGTVSGLAGKGLILKDNGGDDLQVASDGPFVFPARVKNGDPYAVTVSGQPSEPSQACSVANGAGTVHGANVTDVAVTCSTAAFSVGGVVVGLNGASGLVLTNNGADDLSVPAAGGAFTFPTKVPSGSPFAVAVKAQPNGGGPCAVSGGSGTMGVADVTSVVVNCAPGTYTVGGTVTGLVGTVVLQNNAGPDLVLTASGSFAFPQTLTPSATYSVTVKTQPGYPPRSQTCTVTNASGTMGSANVTNVTVTCTTNTFSVGGNVTGLSGTVILKNNGGDALSVNASGPFTFATKLASGSAYAVTVGTQPSGQTCNVSSGSGTVTSANVTNVAVSCAAATDPGILCAAGTYCGAGKNCCWDNSLKSGVCVNAGSCANSPISCDDAFDCGGGYCCGRFKSSGDLNSTACVAQPGDCTASASGSIELWCDPGAGTGCPGGQSCTGTSKIALFHKCQ